MLPGTVTSDSDLVAELLANRASSDRRGRATATTLERALTAVLPRLEGAFSFVLMDDDHVIGVRDPNGFRPLCLGRLDNGWVLASETPALDIVGAHFVREIDPGEMVIIDADRRAVVQPFPTSGSTRSCACSSSSTSPGPTAASTAAACTPPGCAGRAARRAGARSRPTW